MLYDLHELQRSILAPFTAFTETGSHLFSNPYSPLAYTPLSRQFAISARGDVDGDNMLSWFILRGYALGQDITISSAVGIVNQEE